MLILLSPSKTLEERKLLQPIKYTTPYFTREILELVKIMQTKTSKNIQDLMKVSSKIADLNYQRFQNFSDNFTPENSKPALSYFKGDVYENIEVENYKEQDLNFAQEHLFILSGLYGILRPLDLMQPYRLEMGIRLKNKYGKDLYQFWGNKIAELINQHSHSGIIINLASNEYFKAVNKKVISGKIIDIIFKNEKKGELKTIGLFAKKARGAMANYIIKNKIENFQNIKDFNEKGYKYNPRLSNEQQFVFVA